MPQVHRIVFELCVQFAPRDVIACSVADGGREWLTVPFGSAPGMRAALGIAGLGTCSELHDLLAVDLWRDARDVSF